MQEVVRYYAHIDKVEVDPWLELFFEFHCLEKNFADNVLSLHSDLFHQSLQERRDEVIILTGTKAKVSEYFGSKDYAETESQWMLLTTNRMEDGLEASLYVENNEESTTVFINGFEFIDPESPTGRLLFDKVSLNDFSDTEDKEKLVSTLTASSRDSIAEFIAVYNVGQGNCNAVCNEVSMPLLYFDLGGGCYTNSYTYPQSLRFCFSLQPAIVLSHWDTDHYQSAKLNPLFKNQQWIVPRQVIGPVHLKFFLSLPPSRIIWPAFLNELQIPWGKFVLCLGPRGKKNHTGLAFLAKLSPSRNTFKNVLLSADAAYTYIPGSGTIQFDGLVATHHGANFDQNNQPIPSPNGSNAIVYSYGHRNSYKHPKRKAIVSHINAGWSRKAIKTKDGHIAIADNITLPTIPCNGGICDLQLSQIV